jgi:hypothetical protein
LEDHTPREAAADATLHPKLIDLIHGLEGMYHNALKNGDPTYDPSWMWSELGLEDGSRPTYIPPLAHERIVSMVPGLGKLCRGIAEQLRRQPAFDDRSTILTAEDIRTNLEIQRFLRENRSLQIEDQDRIMPGADILTAHIELMINAPPFHGTRLLASRGSWMAGPADAVDRSLLERAGCRCCD